MNELSFRTENLRAIVFDLDGTLYQNEQMGDAVNLGACRYIASIRGISVDEADNLLQDARFSIGGKAGTLSRAVESLGGNLKDLHKFLSDFATPEGVLEVDERVPELLEDLATRFELYVYTNNNRTLSARIMEAIGVTGIFRQIFTIEDYWEPKPDENTLKGMFECICRKPEETLFVGDRYEVDLAIPESMGAQIYLSCTIEELLALRQLIQ
jgi:putative hydrolase of the HAD superfamily